MINLRWKVTASIVAVLALFLLARLEALQVATTTPQAITTYHYDNLRTGWNSNETALTPDNVHSTTFGLRHTVSLDQQVDVQPLLVPGEDITPGQHQEGGLGMASSIQRAKDSPDMWPSDI